MQKQFVQNIVHKAPFIKFTKRLVKKLKVTAEVNGNEEKAQRFSRTAYFLNGQIPDDKSMTVTSTDSTFPGKC